MISDRHPDVAIVFRDSPRDQRGRRQPKLVVEVVSPGREAHERDYITKREEYLELGLLEHWIVDRNTNTVTVLTRVENAEGAEWSERAFGRDNYVITALLPGFSFAVWSLWIDLEADDDDEE